jgi:hypothetical protein
LVTVFRVDLEIYQSLAIIKGVGDRSQFHETIESGRSEPGCSREALLTEMV